MAPVFRLERIGLFLLAVCLSAVSSVVNAQTRPSFNYTLDGADWGGLCVTGTSQSPINLRQARAVNSTLRGNSSLVIDYKPLSNYTVTNKGHTIELGMIGEGNYLTLPTIIYNPSAGGPANSSNSTGGRLTLLQSHFHEPSEHTREGLHYPLEQHFVHNDTVTGQLAVIGVFYKIDDNETDNRHLNQMLKYTPTSFNNQSKVTNETIDLPAWPPINGTGYYHYNGSLTTPPCSQNILWFVLDTPLTVSSAQLIQFQRLAFLAGGDRGDNRPLQSLGTRVLSHFAA